MKRAGSNNDMQILIGQAIFRISVFHFFSNDPGVGFHAGNMLSAFQIAILYYGSQQLNNIVAPFL